jgi:hypothetical protein
MTQLPVDRLGCLKARQLGLPGQGSLVRIAGAISAAPCRAPERSRMIEIRRRWPAEESDPANRDDVEARPGITRRDRTGMTTSGKRGESRAPVAPTRLGATSRCHTELRPSPVVSDLTTVLASDVRLASKTVAELLTPSLRLLRS